jgi:hypothetical protein
MENNLISAVGPAPQTDKITLHTIIEFLRIFMIGGGRDYAGRGWSPD